MLLKSANTILEAARICFTEVITQNWRIFLMTLVKTCEFIDLARLPIDRFTRQIRGLVRHRICDAVSVQQPLVTDEYPALDKTFPHQFVVVNTFPSLYLMVAKFVDYKLFRSSRIRNKSTGTR